MERAEIKKLDNEIVTEKQFDEIELAPEVTEVNNLGFSSSHPGCNWYNVEFEDGESIDIFLRRCADSAEE